VHLSGSAGGRCLILCSGVHTSAWVSAPQSGRSAWWLQLCFRPESAPQRLSQSTSVERALKASRKTDERDVFATLSSFLQCNERDLEPVSHRATESCKEASMRFGQGCGCTGGTWGVSGNRQHQGVPAAWKRAHEQRLWDVEELRDALC
jgi:uncharacterized protein with PIN domain